MKPLLSLSSLCIILIFQSCISNTAFQTGKTIGKNNIETISGISLGEYLGQGRTMQPHMSVRYGFTDKLDIDFGGSFNGIRVDTKLKLKYQLLGNQDSKFAASLGLGIKTDFRFVGVDFPVYLSYHPTSKFAIYTSPRYRSGYLSADSEKTYKETGLVSGIKFGNKVSLFVEHSLLNRKGFVNDRRGDVVQTKRTTPFHQFSLGFGLDF